MIEIYIYIYQNSVLMSKVLVRPCGPVYAVGLDSFRGALNRPTWF